MKQKFLIRYLILMGILVLCAAAAWFITNASAQPEENAVLAELSEPANPKESLPDGLSRSANPRESLSDGLSRSANPKRDLSDDLSRSGNQEESLSNSLSRSADLPDVEQDGETV